MQTHDEETRRYFKHSSVQVLLCPRVAGKRHSWVKKKVFCIEQYILKVIRTQKDIADVQKLYVVLLSQLIG